MGVNIKRGFNRLYIVLAIVWAAYCLVIYPRLQIKEAMTQYGQNTAMCYDTRIYGPDGKAECVKRAESLFRIEFEPWSFKNYYRMAWAAPEAVVLQFEKIIGMVERLGAERQLHRLDFGERIH